MAVRIRLTRVGMTKQPTYRFVVTDSRNARDGRSLATLGHYNPRTEPIEISVDADKAKEWMSKGAKPSDTVERLFRVAGVLPKRAEAPTTAPARGPRKPDKQSKAAKRAAAPPAPAPAPAAEPVAEAPAEEPTAAAQEPAAAEEAASEETASGAPAEPADSEEEKA